MTKRVALVTGGMGGIGSASDDAGYITGANIAINGGMYMT